MGQLKEYYIRLRCGGALHRMHDAVLIQLVIKTRTGAPLLPSRRGMKRSFTPLRSIHLTHTTRSLFFIIELLRCDLFFSTLNKQLFHNRCEKHAV